MTWNIHAGIGADARYDLHRILRHIAPHTPDILALQEIDARGRPADPFPLLRDALGGHAAEARTIVEARGAYGHVLISRWPIGDVTLHDLSVPGREPRAAISAAVATPAGTLRVVATHLGLRLNERQRQATRLAQIIAACGGPLVALGDFNEWSWNSAVRRALSPLLPTRTATRTCPVWFPCIALDRIYCRAPLRLQRSWTDRSARAASDHLPVIAELQLDYASVSAGTKSFHRPGVAACSP